MALGHSRILSQVVVWELLKAAVLDYLYVERRFAVVCSPLQTWLRSKVLVHKYHSGNLSFDLARDMFIQKIT